MAEAYIIDALRTPMGKKKGSLANLHPADLAAHPLRELFARHDVDAGAVDDCIWGCCDAIGPQAGDIGRTAWLVAGLPQHVPGTTVDRQCGSSQQAVHFAAQAVMSGTQDLVVAGGSQAMNAIPISAAMFAGQPYGFGDPFTGSAGWVERYGGGLLNQIKSAQMIADKWGISRVAMEQFAVTSHARAHAATESGAFEREIAPLNGLSHDETIRPTTSLEGLAALNPVGGEGTITAGVASQNCDGAAALLIANEQAVKDHGLTPRARIHHISVTAGDPVIMLVEPLFATEKALKKAGMSINDIDAYEVNEAFAPVPLAWMKYLGASYDRLNVHGGAIALGHPLGASGTKLMATLLGVLDAKGGKYGLQTMCEGGGQANVTIIERH